MCPVARCRAEIAAIEAQIRAGHPDLQGLCLALADWSTELRLLQAELRVGQCCATFGSRAFARRRLDVRVRPPGTAARSSQVRASRRVLVDGNVKTYRKGKPVANNRSASGAGIAAVAPRFAHVRAERAAWQCWTTAGKWPPKQERPPRPEPGGRR